MTVFDRTCLARIGFVCSLFLAGCSGSSGSTSPSTSTSGDSGGSGSNNAPAAPTVSFAASDTSVAAGSAVTLSWSSSGASSCEASGGWSGTKSTSGTEVLGPIEQSTSVVLSCSGPGGGAVRQLDITVSADGSSDAVAVQLNAAPDIVGDGGVTTLTWSASNATVCRASGSWSGDRPVTGSEVVGPLTADANFQLSCEGASGNALSLVSVRVADKTLRWQAPTQNVDGSPLTDLAGYRVYWGTTSRSYDGSATIDSPTTTEWEAADLATGEYFFALTAFDSEDNESGYSNEVLKLIP